MGFAWTPEKVKTLTELVAERKTAMQIACVFGITRNAVIGKLSRLGLRLISSETGGGLRPRRPKMAKTSKPILLAVPPTPMPVLVPVPVTVAVLAPFDRAFVRFVTHATGCKWPVGDPRTEDFYFCNATRAVIQRGRLVACLSPYCDQHSKVAYRDITDAHVNDQ